MLFCRMKINNCLSCFSVALTLIYGKIWQTLKYSFHYFHIHAFVFSWSEHFIIIIYYLNISLENCDSISKYFPFFLHYQIRPDQISRSVVSDSWIAARQASLSINNSWSSLRLTSIESVMPSSHLILYHPLLLLPPIPPSISLFQWVNSLHEVAKVLEFQL